MSSVKFLREAKRTPVAALLAIAGMMVLGCPAAALAQEPDQLTPLVSAAVSGNTEIARDLIDKGADINRPDARGNFPLYAAVIGDHAEIVELLLERGAKVNQAKAANTLPVKERNNAALHAACLIGNQKVVELLVNAGADVNAFANVNEETAKYFQNPRNQKGINPSLLPSLLRASGVTPLMLASKGGHVDVARFLLEHGANVNFQTPGDNTALIEAAIAGNRDVLELLLNWKADISRPGAGGETALVYALVNQQYDSARFLLSSGADLVPGGTAPVSEKEALDRKFAWGIYETLLGDKLTSDGQGVEAKSTYAEALTSLKAARIELGAKADQINKQADEADKHADKADKQANRPSLWIPILEIVATTVGGALTDYSRGPAQTQMAQVLALRNSKTPNQYFANYEKLAQGLAPASLATTPPSTSDNTAGAHAGNFDAKSSLRDSAQLMRTVAQSMRASAQIFSERAVTCDYLIERLTKLGADEALK